MEVEDDDALFEDDLDDVVLNEAVVNSFSRPKPPHRVVEKEHIDGFDESEGCSWIYPINYPLRSYQFNIVQKALFWNTLVTLPTGLGKTFVAAVVIHNFYRWYPNGKILFMAPTKPLVAQQIRACHDIVGIPQKDLGELTGNLNPAKRDIVWKSKRVFFLTPQVVQNDLGRGTCPAAEIVLVVVDEAHKATGNHAYCQVVRELQNYKSNFRVLALSATPGDNLETVQSVLSNLLIAHVEIRSEESLDIHPYLHNRKIDKVILPLDQPLDHLKNTFLKTVLEKHVTTLLTHRALYCKDISTLSKFSLLQQRDGWRTRAGDVPGQTASMIEGTFFMLMTLYQAFEFLLIHGAGVFLHYCMELLEGKKGTNSTKSRLLRDQDFLSVVDKVQRWRNSGIAHELNNCKFVNHPKITKLLSILTQHFTNADDMTRAMVFSSFRDSVQDLVKTINESGPLLRSSVFIGQSGAKGMRQKEQLKTVKDFREGVFNVLVATCVGEEGLDIGMVDLIVCFDASASPTRLVQRMGRAARKRDGSIVVLLTAGKEEQTFKKSMSSKKSVSKAVMTRLNKLVLYSHNPRMIPKHLDPKPEKHVLNPAEFLTPPHKPIRSKSVAQKQKCPFLSSTQYNSFMGSNSTDDTLNNSARFSLNECLSKWIHWQGSEHPTFDIEHSMSTLTLVHVMEVNDLFKAEPTAISNFEAEMEQYLNLDDVIVTNKETSDNEPSQKSLDSTPQKPCRVTNKLYVISDDDGDDFESTRSLKQSKLNFKSKVNTLFSCLPKDTVKIKTNEQFNLVKTEVVDIESKDESKGESDMITSGTSNSKKSSSTTSSQTFNVCDVQHDVSFEDLPSLLDIEPENLENLPENGCDKENVRIDLNTSDSLPNVEVSKDLRDNDISMSLFEAINNTWDPELSRKPPNFDSIPLPPSQVPVVEISDFSLICSQATQPEILTPGSLPFQLSRELETVKPCSKPVPIVSPIDESQDDLENTFFNENTHLLNSQNEALFASLAKIEKQQSVDEDMFDKTVADLLENNCIDEVLTDENYLKRQNGDILSVTTPYVSKPFKPLEASTPALPKLEAPTPASPEKLFVTPQVKPSLKRQKPPVESTECESPLVMGKRKRRCNILCSQVASNEDSNEQKRSRSSLADKATLGYREANGKEGGACPFIDNEAALSGDDEEFDARDEDLMSSSLEDFIDKDNDQTVDETFYLKDIKENVHQQQVRLVGQNFVGNVYSQDPRLDDLGDVEEGEFDSFICDDESFSLLDDFEETAVFTQKVKDQTPTPAKSKRTKKRRVREFVESPSTQAATTAFVPHRQIPISGTINLSPEKNQVFTSPSKKAQVAPSHKAIPVSSKSIAKMPEVVRNIVVSKSSVKQNPKQVIDKVSAENVPQTCAEEDMGNISSFLLGLEDLLSDEEQDKMSDDDDFLDISLLRKSRTQSKKSSRNPAPKTGVATTITSVSVPKTLMTTHSVVGQCDTSVDLFGDSLNESAIEAACQKINCAPLNPTKINCAPLNPPKTNRISSQFDIDVDFLLPVHEELSCSINQLAGLSVHTKPCSVPNLQRLRNAHSRKENNPNTHSRSKFDDCLIFVRTRVVSNNQICSMLRAKYAATVEIRGDISDCDYIVNSDTAILRITLLDVYKGMVDLLDRAKSLLKSFKHIVLLAELPNEVPGKKKKVVGRSETYDAVKFALAEQKLKPYNTTLLLSESQERTAEFIVSYISSTHSVTIPTTPLTDKQKSLEAMLTSLPWLNPGNVRLLVNHFSSLVHILSSAAEEISKVGAISRLNTALFIKYCKTTVANQAT